MSRLAGVEVGRSRDVLDLSFAERQQRLNAFAARIAPRPAGVSMLDVFRATTEEMISDLAPGVTRRRRTILGSTPLQKRRTLG